MKTPHTPEEAVRFLEKECGLHDIACKNWGEKASGFAIFYAWQGQERVFVKWGGKPGNCRNDYNYTKRLHEACPEHFLRPFFCVDAGETQCLALEYAEGRTLKTALSDGTLSEEEKKEMVEALPRIAKALIASNCVHRDVKPDNFLLTPQGVKLFDFEFATDATPYKEREEILRYPWYVSVLGSKSECGVKLGVGKFMWDDMAILRRVLQRIGCAQAYAEAYAEAEAFFRAEEGKRVIRYPGRVGVILQRKLVDILSCLMPVRSWRHKVRLLNRRARSIR